MPKWKIKQTAASIMVCTSIKVVPLRNSNILVVWAGAFFDCLCNTAFAQVYSKEGILLKSERLTWWRDFAKITLPIELPDGSLPVVVPGETSAPFSHYLKMKLDGDHFSLVEEELPEAMLNEWAQLKHYDPRFGYISYEE